MKKKDYYRDNDGNIWIWDGNEYRMGRECLKCSRWVLPEKIKDGVCDECRSGKIIK